jgi:hypothetical protein
MLEYVEEHK